jgi:hypothetical protein
MVVFLGKAPLIYGCLVNLRIPSATGPQLQRFSNIRGGNAQIWDKLRWSKETVIIEEPTPNMLHVWYVWYIKTYKTGWFLMLVDIPYMEHWVLESGTVFEKISEICGEYLHK